MSVFSKLFKKNKKETGAYEEKEQMQVHKDEKIQEVKVEPILDPTDEKIAIDIRVDGIKTKLTADQEYKADNDGYETEEFKNILSRISELNIDIIPVSYENFLESNMVLKYDTIREFSRKLNINNEQYNHLKQTVFNTEKTYNELDKIRLEVTEFREKEKTLKNKILEYTAVVNKINEKKLSGDEFKKVESTIKPQIDKINIERDNFLKEEIVLNKKLEDVYRNMVKDYRVYKEIAEKIN